MEAGWALASVVSKTAAGARGQRRQRGCPGAVGAQGPPLHLGGLVLGLVHRPGATQQGALEQGALGGGGPEVERADKVAAWQCSSKVLSG